MRVFAAVVLLAASACAGADFFGCEAGTGLVTVQDDCNAADNSAASLDALAIIFGQCSSSESADDILRLQCKKSSSGAYGIVITKGQAPDLTTGAQRKRVLSGKTFIRP